MLGCLQSVDLTLRSLQNCRLSSRRSTSGFFDSIHANTAAADRPCPARQCTYTLAPRSRCFPNEPDGPRECSHVRGEVIDRWQPELFDPQFFVPSGRPLVFIAHVHNTPYLRTAKDRHADDECEALSD